MLLHHPRIPIRIIKKDKRVPIPTTAVNQRRAFLVTDRTDGDAALDQLGAGRVHVGHDELQAPDRPRRHVVVHAHADDDGTPRFGRRQLHDAQVVADSRVVIDDKADLFAVEMLGSIDVGHGNDDNFQFPVHWFIAPVHESAPATRRARWPAAARL